ncbi:MAG TPA: hypothetical protein PLW61_05965 [Caldisericia bacterium]|nr:hypothetical protein [Caldisericia bacterium]HPB34289.1 hypothetical protein [Caldisericia bacterium]HQN49201.1 hypothetical protein [Caldisericia bacterium]HQP00398.1 hypothetical protein [Caldisericia bacterium]HRT03874.1 hypothetical protein [Candidatus Diapherotrites archaeon]
MSKECEVFYEERVDKETYRFYYDEDLGEVEIHCIYKSGDEESLLIPVKAVINFIKKLEVK